MNAEQIAALKALADQEAYLRDRLRQDRLRQGTFDDNRRTHDGRVAQFRTVEVALDPAGASTPVGEEFTVTATVQYVDGKLDLEGNWHGSKELFSDDRGEYVVQVINWDASGDWDGTKSYVHFDPPTPGSPPSDPDGEAYTITCGSKSKQVKVRRGETVGVAAVGAFPLA
mgnify:CR=1 FL=1